MWAGERGVDLKGRGGGGRGRERGRKREEGGKGCVFLV